LLTIYISQGAVKLKQGGSAAGHNGVQDIYNQVPGEWLRMRFGVGEPVGSQRRDDFVLAPFHPRELPLVEGAIARSLATLDIWLALGSTVAQNECNGTKDEVPSLIEVLKRREQRKKLNAERELKAAANATTATTPMTAGAETSKKK
jgi:hypothetical protein